MSSLHASLAPSKRTQSTNFCKLLLMTIFHHNSKTHLRATSQRCYSADFLRYACCSRLRRKLIKIESVQVEILLPPWDTWRKSTEFARKQELNSLKENELKFRWTFLFKAFEASGFLGGDLLHLLWHSLCYESHNKILRCFERWNRWQQDDCSKTRCKLNCFRWKLSLLSCFK